MKALDESFVHLHVHSCYSMLRGVSPIEALLKSAAEMGCAHLALTDTDGLFGIINFLDAAPKYGIRPIVGAHLGKGDSGAVFLVKSERGYELLSELVSSYHLNKDFSFFHDVSEARRDLALLARDPELIKALRSKIDCRVELVAGPSSRRALEISRSVGAPPVATNAVYFAHPQDYPLHRLVRAIALNRTLSTLPPQETVQPEQWLKPPAEMAKRFPHCPQAIENSVALARECHTEWSHFRTIFPSYKDREEDHFALLHEECRKGVSWRYGKSDGAIEKRLSEELDLIRLKGYVDYFLVVADIVRRRPIHCGRGSGAASLVSYLLGITHVDPIRHRLLFGRFLNPERKDLPDIDIDFPWDERDELFAEVRKCYGDDRVAFIANHIGFRGRAAVREVAKVYGIPSEEIKEVTRRMGFWVDPARIRKRMDEHPKFQGFALDPPWPEIIDLASRLESLPRFLSTHCGGIIIVPDRITRYAPVQHNTKGSRIVQWEKDQVEMAGLVKIDLLGNRSLAVIRDALAAIEKNTGKSIDYASFNPVDDPAALDLMKRGDTMGVFYMESPAMRQLQQKTRRGDFEHLVIHSSIIRPAANRYIREYIRRLHGGPYEPIHPDLTDLLSETYGILVYQEDVVRAAMALAGFSWGEADGLRKIISKKSPEKLSQYRRRFVEGCSERGIPPEVIDTVWDMFLSFSGYSFCKPHSASYALVSFKSAYLKAHYPAEFMAAVLSNGGGYYSTLAYLSEAGRMGIKTLGPDVNESEWRYRGKERFIRMGLQQLQSVSKETTKNILKEKETNGPFVSLENFLERVKLNPADIPILVKSGALDSLAGKLNRPQILWFMESWVNRRSAPRKKGAQMKAFSHSRSRPVPSLPDLSDREKQLQEMDALGFVLSVHPLDLFEPFIKSFPQHRRLIPASDLVEHVGKKVWTLGWPVTRKEVLTREKEPMEFVSFEDKTAIYEAVFFPEAFKRFCQELDRDRPYILYGRVESDFGAVSLNVQKLCRIWVNG